MHNSRLNNYSGSNRNRLVYFQLKSDYYSNNRRCITPHFWILPAFIWSQCSLVLVTFSWFFHKFNKRYMFTCYKSSYSYNLLTPSCLLILFSHLVVRYSQQKQFKNSWRADCTGHCTCNDNLIILCCWDLLLLESIYFKCKLCLFEKGYPWFEQDISCSIFISIRYM